jgi:hypothetical protein
MTRQPPAARGASTGTPGAAAAASKQAVIGMLPMPTFLAPLK